KYFKTKIDNAKKNPHYFEPDGLTIFVGPQGSGKTLSAVQYVKKVLKDYPKAKLVTNISIKDYLIITYEEFLFNNVLEDNEISHTRYFNENRVFPFNNADDLEIYDNGELGVIYFIDEIHLYFNSLESKNINMDTMTVFAQQRKCRKHIVATSQVFGRMAKPLREQFSNVIKCQCYLGFLQINKFIDRDSILENTDDSHLEGKVRRRYFWFHSYKYYNDYDTYYLISRNKFIANELKKGDIYDYTTQLPIDSRLTS
ncbi:zonular occludens toxin domain-containing protein, partial [Anaerorhabdus sp.]|uniref:zonular occludens toxin domain-containing protein n=1 Tax=Anaerorhabdus sp. TaxID=1872524 RepID=UPI002FC82A9E